MTTPIPGGAGPQPPGVVRARPPRRPHLNVIRFLAARYSYVVGREVVDDGSGTGLTYERDVLRWTLIWYRDDFYVWVGTHWRVLAEATLRAEVYEVFKNAVYIHWPAGATAVPEWRDFDPDPAKMNALMQGIKDETLVDAGVDMPVWLDAEENLALISEAWPAGADPRGIISCQNGLLNTATGLLWGHTPRYLNSYAVDYAYDPSAARPVEWIRFLKSVWPEDDESILALQEWFGYLLTQRNEQQKMLMLYGAKRGGKGTIIRILEALMGEDNVTGTSIADLNHGDFGLASLEGKQLAVMSDVRFRSRDDGTAVERLLKITGNDRVLINKKYKQPYTARLTTRFLMASNELPKMTDESGALQGRIVLLKFKESFLGREDLELEGRLRGELPGILNWSLEGLRRLDERGWLRQPQSGVDDLEVIQELGSPVLAFITECCEVNPAGMVGREELYSVWRTWAGDNGVIPGSKIAFGKALRAAVPPLEAVKRGPRGAQTWQWEGIDLGTGGRVYLARWQAVAGLTGYEMGGEPGREGGEVR